MNRVVLGWRIWTFAPISGNPRLLKVRRTIYKLLSSIWRTLSSLFPARTNGSCLRFTPESTATHTASPRPNLSASPPPFLLHPPPPHNPFSTSPPHPPPLPPPPTTPPPPPHPPPPPAPTP